MAQQIIDVTTNNGSYTGDPAKIAFQKVNANFTECYTNIGQAQSTATSAATAASDAQDAASSAASAASAAETTANAALPKAGGNLTGTVRTNSDITFTGTGIVNNLRTAGNPTFRSGGGLAMGWNGLVSGASDFYTFNNGGDGGFTYRTLNVDNSAVVGTFGFGPAGQWLAALSTSFQPSADNAINLGSSANRWATVWSATGTIQTSDERTKTNIVACSLGLEFINALSPKAYSLVVGQNTATLEQVGTTQVQDTNPDGTLKVDAQGSPVMKDMPLYEEKVTAVPGKRTHHGLLAQDVHDTLIKFGMDPSTTSMWILDDPNDPDSQQGLRYEELIGPMIMAIQQLSTRVAALEALQASPASADSGAPGTTAS